MPDVEGFFSGFMPVKQGATSQPTYTVPVKSEKPLWFYCSQGKHCQAGMVGAINAATTGNKTIEAFAALAAAAPENLAPGGSSGSSSSAYGSGSNTASASMSMSTTDASSTATESSASSTTTAGTTVQSKAASPKLLAGPQEVLTGLSMAALLSAVLL